MRLLTETGVAVVLAVMIATTFTQCVAHGSAGSDPVPPHDPASAAFKLRCPSGLARASDQPAGAGVPPSTGDAPIRLLSCR
ncbi:MAG: hypothetical protein AB9M53_06335 [Leptothrix sp. (in: b-proteobacteria)]